MNPAASVIFLTTLIGAGQGLFLALYVVELASRLQLLRIENSVVLFVCGSLIALLLSALGLIASFFHLGHPERAWRAAAMWRTSWLSREVIVLPIFMVLLVVYGYAHYAQWEMSLAVGAVTAVICVALYICTGMIYACIRFLQEWASPLTLLNYFILGCASGCSLATALAAFVEPDLTRTFAVAAILLTASGLGVRSASLVRNKRLKLKSSLQTALGIHHPRIVQKSQGFMGGSFNTREFFHGKTPRILRSVKWFFLVFAFILPLFLLLFGQSTASAALFCTIFVIQYAGLLAERWFFFAQANHPQNLYYQTIS
ncbi:dimethyl sulfoxide reductase anchor subunit [Glaciimonas sp. CA11.2]|uniref:dimethyl sulfoxide reductase anchor subunit family protein n=1 Tax=unclassified Glaciimonas TaxID=2644401 RepID=UPI002AB5A870|nr:MULTISPECIES: DmsC/YnfH family molybdoenzyme membrane anchor subunit [unclassified Glaciimonas]MDY7547707.1 DmsC/YnfH family molybdoenzyme membrane anchor subunit [Glaciimonas sp. CA11.2]MEB0012973.1 dimethyl sulfoxide reductase anchor subunit [Glaciimonas sp. Cout2]MEB0082929.1 dimethyl sulfoxide reductase anchor subunit [Glaciimonas sp. Gout2]MEB0161376.1 dimethyl sulfoxide reductase anchor subunit [Glaciimonas sp. CA11.2]